MWTVKLSKQAGNFYESLTGKHHAQMTNALNTLSQDPYCGKPLKGELRAYWSMRVGIYRIIYSIKAQEVTIEVLRIQHRKEVYEKLRR